MITKKIANIVFYKYYKNGKEEKKTCLFYNDGTAVDVSYEEGIDACEEIVKERHITSKEAFQELINKDIVHVTSLNELVNNFTNYIVNEKDNLNNPISEKENEEIKDEQENNEFIEKENNSDDTEEKDSDDIEDEEFDIEDEEENKKEKQGIFGLIQRGIEKIKKNKLIRRISLCVAAVAVFFGGYTCGARKTKEGAMLNSNINSTMDNNELDSIDNNDYYNDYTFKELQDVTNNKKQKKAMKKLKKVINGYNDNFADHYLEEGKNIRAALKFDEVAALQQAYNDYSKKEIQAYFNGAEINAADMGKDYKAATLQLMGAHVIETSKNPVNMSGILKGEEAKEFYNKFHKIFLEAKEATGEEKIAKVKEFYNVVKKEFPVTNKVRTEGIMHADTYNSIKSYKLSVIPMIAASEIMFQNLEVDNTLNDLEIDFLNDIGLCNYAQDKFEKIETITLISEEDNTNPLYEQYRNAIIKKLKAKNQYVTGDKERDLSKLDSFQKQVNWHFEASEQTASQATETYYKSESYTEENSWDEVSTSTVDKTTTEVKEIPKEEKEKLDEEIEKENNKSKEEAKKEAEETKKEMQNEADKEAEKIKDKIEKDDQDFQNKIDDANDKINNNNKDEDNSNNKPVTEGDFGDRKVDFDDNHSNDKGELNDSVESITTDGSEDQTDEPLPDPNETGEEFDKQSSNAKLVDEYIEKLVTQQNDSADEYGYLVRN